MFPDDRLKLLFICAHPAIDAGARGPARRSPIAWALHRGRDVVPLVGARRRERLEEALAALELGLDRDDLARLEAAVPAEAVAGTRYDAHGMRMLDSEAQAHA
jgi:diketogulonate reductase-like aldo/keto reductase